MRPSTTILALWTLFVWGARIRNAVSGDNGIGPILLSLSFVGLALLVLGTRGNNGFFVVMLGGWTVMVWFVRAIDIVFFSDHRAAFIAVHLALALVSIALVGWVDDDLSGKGRPWGPAARAARRQ